MSPAPPEQTELEPALHGKHDREARCHALREAAVAVFAEAGYDTATTRAVAERAGCAEGLIHRYFGGKRGLLIAILEEKTRQIDESWRAGNPDHATPEEEIAQLLLIPLESMRRSPAFMRVAMSQALIDPEVGEGVAARLDSVRAAIARDKLLKHQREGRLPADADIDAAARAIAALGFSLGCFAQIVFGEDPEHLRDLARRMAVIVSRGLQAGGAAETA